MTRPTVAGLAQAASNLLLAVFYGLFTWRNGAAFLERPRISLALVVVMEGFLAVIAVARAPADRTSLSPYAWLTAFGGTLTPLLLAPVAGAQDLVAGQALQVLGATLGVVGVLSLSRSFGMLPAHRACVRTRGLYRWVRHPLYASYLLLQLGYVLNNPGLANVSIVTLAMAFQLLRLLNEERFLSSYPEYARYKLETPWRLFPYVF